MRADFCSEKYVLLLFQGSQILTAVHGADSLERSEPADLVAMLDPQFAAAGRVERRTRGGGTAQKDISQSRGALSAQCRSPVSISLSGYVLATKSDSPPICIRPVSSGPRVEVRRGRASTLSL